MTVRRVWDNLPFTPVPCLFPFPPLTKGDHGDLCFSARPNPTVNQPKKSSGRGSAILISRLGSQNSRGGCFTPIPTFPHHRGKEQNTGIIIRFVDIVLFVEYGTISHSPSPCLFFPPSTKGDQGGFGFSARPNPTVNQPKKSSGRDPTILISRLCSRDSRGGCFTPIKREGVSGSGIPF